MNPQFSKSYQRSAVQTASPGQLVLMLYDGALKFMTIAENGLELQNMRERNEVVNNNLIKAQNIIAELQSTLDMKVPGEFPRTMFKLYDFMLRQLQQANIEKNKAPIKTVYGMLKDIRDAWEEMLRKNSQKTAEDASNATTPEMTAQNEVKDTSSKIGGGLNVSA